ncbi:hypothetical protein C8Q73DRAFT_676207 [Cubamyces lactineus]|nr:hypothetical protein C8Q73DRAFT_676207 [Cubamyces lactineus]
MCSRSRSHMGSSTSRTPHAPQATQYVGGPVGMLKAIWRIAKACRILVMREADIDKLVWYIFMY